MHLTRLFATAPRIWTAAPALMLAVSVLMVAPVRQAHALELVATPALSSAVDALARSGFRGTVVSGTTEKMSFARSVGMADLARGTALSASSLWPWASVTKQVTALLVMQEVQRGTIALDQPIARYLPSFPGPSGNTVTVRQLLRHTSGLPNPNDTAANPGDMPPFYQETGKSISHQARAFSYCAGAPKAAAGTFDYNNCDYLVLGAILEKVSGQSYRALVKQRLTVPLRLATVDVLIDQAPATAEQVVGYDKGNATVPTANIATLGAAGAMVGTAADLFVLDQAILQGRLLDKAATEEMTRGDPKAGYAALGVWSFPARLAGCAGNVRLVERRGDFNGIQVRNLLAPDLQRALIVFTNDGAFEFGELWQGRGASFDLASAAFCQDASKP